MLALTLPRNRASVHCRVVRFTKTREEGGMIARTAEASAWDSNDIE